MNGVPQMSQGMNSYNKQYNNSDQKRIKYMVVSVVVNTEDFFSFDAYFDKSVHNDNVQKIESKRKEIQDRANTKKLLSQQQQPQNYKTMAAAQHGYVQQPMTTQYPAKFGASKLFLYCN